MALASNLGFPRIGPKRELKKALESYWAGKSTEAELLETGKTLRKNAWLLHKQAGIDHIPSNDFSLYDHVLDAVAMVGAVPERFDWKGDTVDLSTYFRMASGKSTPFDSGQHSINAQPLEMTKWFNTNYHFSVPEFEDNQIFRLASTKCIDEFKEAKELGIISRPVLLGPVSLLHLAKMSNGGSYDPELGNQHKLMEGILDVYNEVLRRLREAGAEWVQLDEPCLSLELKESKKIDYAFAYRTIAERNQGLSILVATYFGSMGENLSMAMNLPVQAIHLDVTTDSVDVEEVLNLLPTHMKLSVGLVDGRNIWKSDLAKSIDRLTEIALAIGTERVIVAPSCSLLHVPVDLDLEKRLEADIHSWLSFAKQKLAEISLLARVLNGGKREMEQQLKENARDCASRSQSPRTNNTIVKQRVSAVSETMFKRHSPYATRKALQHERFNQIKLPTTTIGSFPQTKEIRVARKDFRAGRISSDKYDQYMRDEIVKNIAIQEELGIDVFVHGEPERTDMVEYFAEQLEGIAISEYGWVQSYGSRCVKPPIIHSDIVRNAPMTLNWATFAQQQTNKPVKGMLTGPVTLLQWSFVRDDQPRKDTCLQLALIIRDEVSDLESAAIKVIQIDEPAIREGLPLKHSEWADYLDWAVKCFRLASSSVGDDTQIHTHMCYSEFDEILQAIVDLDADVISIEAARSRMELLQTIKDQGYPNEIGPGIYDIHSPQVASAGEMEILLRKALETISADRLWVNPDCGLKTRNWDEVIPSLRALVQAAARLRKEVAVQ